MSTVYQREKDFRCDVHNPNTVLLWQSSVQLDGRYDYVSNTCMPESQRTVQTTDRRLCGPKEPFHTSEVQRLGSDKVKPSAQVRGKFEMPISALVGDMSVEPCDFFDSTPPILRTFHFTRKALVEFAKFDQGLFQELGRLYLLARVERQIGIHTEIYPYALTCSKIGFTGGGICDDI